MSYPYDDGELECGHICVYCDAKRKNKELEQAIMLLPKPPDDFGDGPLERAKYANMLLKKTWGDRLRELNDKGVAAYLDVWKKVDKIHQFNCPNAGDEKEEIVCRAALGKHVLGGD